MKRVLIVGAGRQGMALARYWVRKGAHVVVTDSRAPADLKRTIERHAHMPLRWALGGHPLELLHGVDEVYVSGGVPLDIPLLQEARARGLPLRSDADLFFEIAPCPVVGITGSSGKTTTTTLLGRMARAAEQGNGEGLPPRFRKVWVGGNIGMPLIDQVFDMHSDDVAVMEVSSFQLDLCRHSPHIAVVLNITPNHLDRHKTMQAYIEAKAQIVVHQRKGDYAVLSWDDRTAWSLWRRTRAQVVAFALDEPRLSVPAAFIRGNTAYWRGQMGGARPLFHRSQVELPGEHNVQNALAAAAAAMLLGLTPAHIQAGLHGFQGVAHRLEPVAEIDGVLWVNDSIATTPHRAMAAIRAYQHRPVILLAGGKDKDLSWEEWASLVKEHVKAVVAFGKDGDKILQALQPVPQHVRVRRVQPLQQALEEAARLAQPGDVVLLSPGATSFDEFPNYEARGEFFRAWVRSRVSSRQRLSA